MLEYSMSVKLLTEHHLEFLSLYGGFTGSSQSTHVKNVKISHCWKSHVAAHFYICVWTFICLFFLTCDNVGGFDKTAWMYYKNLS